MENRNFKIILQANIRANPKYELIPFNRLPEQYRKVIPDFQEASDFYGILHPRAGNDVRIKVVCQETALLYSTLYKPGKIPDYVRDKYEDKGSKAIAELVFDEILEIEWGGQFTSGTNAYDVLCNGKITLQAHGTISRFSFEALKYAQTLDIEESLMLAARMYFYNRVPISPKWIRMFPTEKSVLEHLLGPQSMHRSLLENHWTRISLKPPNDGWLMWKPRHYNSRSRKSTSKYKSYISPNCEYIRDAFQAILKVLLRTRPVPFKVGKNFHNLLRPDKMLVYFQSFKELQEFANDLHSELDGCRVHGVPFTAQTTPDGLFSWGIDPPREYSTLFLAEKGESFNNPLRYTDPSGHISCSNSRVAEGDCSDLTTKEILACFRHRTSV